MEAIRSCGPTVSAQSPFSRGGSSGTRKPVETAGIASSPLYNTLMFSNRLWGHKLSTIKSSRRNCRGPISASYSHGGNPEQPAWGNITDQDLAVLQERIRIVREKERQLKISVSWLGKDLEASFFQSTLQGSNQAQLAGSNFAWVNNPMVMSALSMTPLYLLYVAFMVGCMNHGSIGGVPV